MGLFSCCLILLFFRGLSWRKNGVGLNAGNQHVYMIKQTKALDVRPWLKICSKVCAWHLLLMFVDLCFACVDFLFGWVECFNRFLNTWNPYFQRFSNCASHQLTYVYKSPPNIGMLDSRITTNIQEVKDKRLLHQTRSQLLIGMKFLAYLQSKRSSWWLFEKYSIGKCLHFPR